MRFPSRIHDGLTVFVIVAGSLNGTAAAAQLSPATSANLCIDTISASRMTRVPAYLTVGIDSTARDLANGADIVAERVATTLRESLGARGDSLPPGEPRLKWRTAWYALQLTAHRNGPLTIDSISRDHIASADSLEYAAEKLLARALQVVRAQDEPFFLWADTSARDSVRFALHFVIPAVQGNGSVEPISRGTRPKFPVFSILAPRQYDAYAAKGGPRPEYPEYARSAGINATVMMQFVVDTTGRADPATIKAFWPPNVPPLTGERARVYNSFVEAAESVVKRTKYVPASFGGCKVKVLTRQPYLFQMAR